jgi:hypothetical protein
MSLFRVSEVESFRQWRNDEEAELVDLLARLRGLSEPSSEMLAGTAFHKALEDAQDGEVDVLQADGYTFEFLTDAELAIPSIRELRASKTYMVDGEPITITGQVDTLEGRRVEDHKTTGRFDPERYLDGYQWRLYLDIFGADHFRWNVFEIAPTSDPAHWDVRNHHTLEQFRYPAMPADCEKLVTEFAHFVREYLPERCKARAAA